jgi:hypothetical protein
VFLLLERVVGSVPLEEAVDLVKERDNSKDGAREELQERVRGNAGGIRDLIEERNWCDRQLYEMARAKLCALIGGVSSDDPTRVRLMDGGYWDESKLNAICK